MHAHSSLRRKTVLEDNWMFIPDVYGLGQQEGVFAKEHGDADWHSVSLPACADQLVTQMDGYRGMCWFRRTFQNPAQPHERLWLHIGAVAGRLSVYLDGVNIHENRDSFLPITLNLTDLVENNGEHVLALCVDNTPYPEDIPGPRLGWEMPCGILRPISLVVTQNRYIHDVFLHADPNEGYAEITAQIEIANASEQPTTMDIELHLTNPQGEACIAPLCQRVALSESGTTAITIDTRLENPACWSPESPALYHARIVLLEKDRTLDDIEHRFGVRNIRTQGKELYLNDVPVYLRGFNRHEDSPDRGMLPNPRCARADLLAMKEMGCNFIRLAHYPHDTSTLELCDELGLIVMAEVPVYWWGGKPDEESAQILKAGKRQLEALIRRDRNHASILFWSVSNETNEQLEHVARGNAELIAHARTVDSTRLVTHVSTLGRITEETSNTDDLLCVNDYPGVVDSSKGAWDPEHAKTCWIEQLQDLHQRFPNHPILVTEFGYPAFAGIGGCAYSEKRQQECLEAEFEGIEAGNVCGTVVWCWADHPWPKGFEKPQLTTSTYGIYTRERSPKAAVQTVRELFRKSRERKGI